MSMIAMTAMTAAFSKHPHWTAVTSAIEIIQNEGYEAWLAGGCVRDLIMKRTPNDFDIATNATPDQLRPLFPRSLEVGREFGVTILPQDGFQLEIATFRKDGPYLDGRRPSSIEFADAKDDAARRDFTVNALFYDLKAEKIFDFVSGQKDITARIIRTVGEPDRRFEEDKLRLLRAVRFAAQLDFTIAPETLVAIKRLSSELKIVSRERVRDEMLKLMKSGGRGQGLDLLFETGLLWEIVPAFPKPVEAREALRTSWLATDNLTVLWALLLKHCFRSEGETKVYLKHMTFPVQQITEIVWIIKNSASLVEPRLLKLSTLIRLLANRSSNLALTYHSLTVAPVLKENLNFIQQVREKYLINENSLPTAWVNGGDLQMLGVEPGPEMGKLLERAYDDQLEQKFATRDQLLASLKGAN